MADFEAKIKATLDTSDIEKQLHDLDGRKITLDADLGSASKDVEKVSKNIQAAQKSANSFGNALKSAFNFGGVFTLISKAVQALDSAARGAIDSVKEIDSAITDLRMATGGSYEEVSQLVKSYNELGKTLGATTTEVSSGADAFLRQGHSIADTNTLIRDSMILSKIAGIESADAAQYLTSSMKGYGVAVDDVIGIVDKLTSVDLVSATDAGGLAEAMSKTAVSANKVGVSMDELLGYLAVVGETTQDSMSSIGNTFKTIFARYTDIKDNKLELIDEDGTTETLSNVEQSLANVGIDMRSTITEFDDFGDMLADLNSKWDTLNGLQQNAIAESLGGTRYKERFLILMENYDAATSYMETAMNSSGTAEKKFDAYLDSIEAKTKSLQASFESLATNTISAEIFGGIIDATNSVVTFLDKTNLLKSSLAGIAGAGTLKVFTTLASGIANAAVQMNNFNTALNLLKTGNIGETQMQQLVQLTANLSESQTKAIVSSSALSAQQRLTILTSQGMSTAEAQAALAAMGLSTAENTATASTFSLSGALKGLWATLMANPFVLVAAGITAAVAAFSNMSQAAEESAQAAADNWAKLQEQAQTASESRVSLKSLIDQYKALSDASNGVWSTEQISELQNIQSQIADLVGDQASNLDLVNGQLDQEYQKLLNIYSMISQNEVAEAESAYLATMQDFEKGYQRDRDFWGNSKENDYQAGWYIRRAYEELNDVSADAAQTWWGSQAGFEDIQWLGDIPTALEAIGSYEEGLEKLYDWRQLLVDATNDGFGDDFGNAYETADALTYLNSKITEFESKVQEAEESKDRFFSSKANDEVLDHLVNNEIESQEDFNDYIDSVLSNDDISKDYAEALINTMAGYFPSFKIPDSVKKSFIAERDDLLSEITENVPEADKDFLGNWLDNLDVSKYQTFVDWWKENSSSEEVTASQDNMMDAFETHLERISIAANGLSTDIEKITSTAQNELSNTQSIIDGISAAQEALTSQSTGKSLSLEDFNSEELKEYADALEYSNGTLQLNAEKVNELVRSKTNEQIAANATNKALAQSEYLKNAAEIENLRQELSTLSDDETATRASIQSNINSLLAENNTIRDTCIQYDLMSASLKEATGAYQAWINAQGSVQKGDMFDSALSAVSLIDETLNNSGSEYYGRIGRSDYKAALDFIIPESVDSSDQNAVNSYLDSISDMFTHDSSGARTGLDIANFCQAAVDAGLMVLNEAGTSYEIAGNKTMADFAEGLGLALPLVQSMFGEMEEFGGQFDWSDEAAQTMGDLAVAATEARETIRSFEGNENLIITLDVNDISDGQEKIDALNNTIEEMKNVKSKVGVDPSEVEAADSIIKHCIAQKQYLTQPDVMKVDTSLVEGNVGSAISKLQEFVSLQNSIELGGELGYDTSQAQADLAAVAAEIQAIDPNISGALEIDTTSLDSISSSIDGLNCEIIAKVIPDDSAIIGYTNPDAQVTVKYSKDTAEIDGYVVPNKEATVTYKKISTDVDSYNPPNLTRTVTYQRTETGTVGVNGTAHASGTAYAGGNWGTSTGGKTLVGELGRELYVNVRTGQWQTVGDTGSEFVDIPKNAIVFNHKQTESLLKNGYVSGRGKALASGNAMVTGSMPVFGSSSSNRGNYKSAASKASGGSNSSEADAFDWIEIAINRIEEAINRVASAATSAYKALKTKLGATYDQISLVNEELALQEKAYTRYLKEADSIKLSSNLKKLVQTGAIDITQYDKDTQELIKDYQEWFEKATACSDAILDLRKNLAELYENNFNDVRADYENQLSQLEHLISNYNNGLDTLEAKGYLESKEYYVALQDIEHKRISMLTSELSALEKSFSEAIGSGEIEKYSDSWYEMQGNINEVKESLDNANLSLIEYANTMREIEWEYFDFIQERIEQLTQESDFLIDLMDSTSLFDDKGKFSETGAATVGLHGLNYNVYMAQADQYAAELLKINKELADDPSNTTLIERREELLGLQQDSILAAESEKQAIKDLVADGFDLELESLQELIDKYTDALDGAKDLYDYQKKIQDHTSEISSIQKQLIAYENDDSEETKATIQKLKTSLKEAEDGLKETEYDQYVEDQKKLLDNLYTEYEELFNQRLDNFDAYFEEMIASVNDNSASINETLNTIASQVGYSMTDGMQNVWNNSDGSTDSVLSVYGDGFNEKLTSINKVLDQINHYVSLMVAGSDAIATSGTVAFASGGLADFTGLAQLDGTPQKPELVLNAEDTQNFLELKDLLREMSSRSLSVDTASSYDVGNVSHLSGITDISSIAAAIRTPAREDVSNSFGDINISIPIDHIDDYNDFVNQLRGDSKFEKMIKDMVISPLTGGSSLSKNKYRW